MLHAVTAPKAACYGLLKTRSYRGAIGNPISSPADFSTSTIAVDSEIKYARSADILFAEQLLDLAVVFLLGLFQDLFHLFGLRVIL